MSDPQTASSIQVQARVQITAQFPSGHKDNDKLAELSGSGRRQVQRAVALYVKDHFPHGVRDDWNSFDLTVAKNGHLDPAEATMTIQHKVSDQRLSASLPDLTVNPNTQTVLYNVHDNVQCTSVTLPLVKKTGATPITKSITVQDGAFASGQGEVEARFQAELKWEVSLDDASQ